MVSKMIDVGAKVDIRVVSQMERSTQIAEDVKIYKSQVCDILENGELELLMPIEAGKLMLLSLGIRYEFVFYNRSGLYKAVGQVKERYKTDNCYMCRVELHSPLSKFQRRQFFRLKCIIDMRYFNITKENMRKIFWKSLEMMISIKSRKRLALLISAAVASVLFQKKKIHRTVMC